VTAPAKKGGAVKGKGQHFQQQPASGRAASTGGTKLHREGWEREIMTVNAHVLAESAAQQQGLSAVACQLLVDSGCCIHVCPVGFASEQGLTMDVSQQLLAANGTKIRVHGHRKVKVRIDGHDVDIHFVVAAVRRPILSVSMLLACCWEVSFSNDVLHVRRGEKLQGIRLSSGVAHGMDSQMRTPLFMFPVEDCRARRGRAATRQPVGT